MYHKLIKLYIDRDGKDRKTPAGRPHIDVVLMFKVIFLQRYYGPGNH